MPISQLSCESFGYGVAACAVTCSQWGGSRLRHDAAFAGRDLEGVSDPRCYRARVLQYGAMSRAHCSIPLANCHAHVSVQLYTREHEQWHVTRVLSVQLYS